VLFVNPGSAGRRRFKLPVTVARLDLGRAPWDVEFIALDNPGDDARRAPDSGKQSPRY
jgi:hypothetical protein